MKSIAFARWVGAIGLGAAAVFTGGGAAHAYTYTNPTYGTSATFPARAFPRIAPASPDGEGQAWRSDEGAEIVIYAIDNRQWPSPRALVAWRRGIDKVTYQRTGEDWAVVSGYLPDGRIFYERYIFRGRLTHSVSVRYPETLRDPYDKLLKPITESLRGPAR
ncbi:hypothetical protein [Aureimonas sp. ME7]|uniref:hypothetical protein n=1 Tax=Aureimonas sp. ME7 TaxID=2744252 RepID=UPI0015F61A44|nr:hypothetical protein [Aureimonas sp. ME7]